MDFKSSFHDFLTAGNSLNIHHKNLQKFVTEVFKVKNGLSPKLMNVFEFFEKPYSLQFRISGRRGSVQQNTV